MRDTYSYLKDPRALAEIQKHKWLESQKAKGEIGFATAAVDWVQRYGRAWKKAYAVETNTKEILIERRKYRRFKLRGIVKLAAGKSFVVAEPLDLSFFGILCRVSQEVSLGSKIRAWLSLEMTRGTKDLDCCGNIERIVPVDAGRYDLFFSFSESCQRKVEKVFFG